MTKIHLSAIFTVPAEVLEEFKSLTQVLTKRVEETEPTTERYIWFCNSEQTEWEASTASNKFAPTPGVETSFLALSLLTQVRPGTHHSSLLARKAPHHHG